MRDGETWKVAEIYAVRKSKLFDEVYNNDAEEEEELEDNISVLNHKNQQKHQKTIKEEYFQTYIN